MSYLVIDKRIAQYNLGKNKSEDIYTFAYITLFDKNRTSTVYASEETIADRTGIPLRTVQSIVSRLKQYPDLMQIETRQEADDKRKNYYTFNRNPKDYYFLDTRFFYLDIPPEIKGFAMRLKAICKNGTNKIITTNGKKGEPNYSQLAAKLHHDRDTVKKHLRDCEKLKLIRKIPNGYLITNDCFLLNQGKDRHDWIYNAIYKFCIDKGVIPPERNDEIMKSGIKRNSVLGIMSSKFIPDEALLEVLNGSSKTKEKFVRRHHLPTVLGNRCKSLPEQPTLEYFLKVLVEYKRPELPELPPPPLIL